MDDLRERCPWDKKQTMESLRHLTIEETYELGDAILDNDLSEIKKELGDVLLHIVFYSKIGSETNDFDIADVCHSICDKLVDRHSHIYSDFKDEHEAHLSYQKALKNSWKSSVSISPIFFKPRLTFQTNSGLPEKSITVRDKLSSIGI